MYNLLTHNDLRLSYKKTGGGSHKVLTFCGVGMAADFFDFLVEFSDHSILAFDLYNKTQTKPFDVDDLKQVFTQFFELFDNEKFDLLSYSIGARIASFLLLNFPDRINRIIFIAPDHFVENRWYKLANYTVFGRWLHKQFVEHPKVLQTSISWAGRIGLSSRKLNGFVLKQAKYPERLKLVYDAWCNYRSLRFSTKEILIALEDNKIIASIILADADEIIDNENIKKRINGAPNISLQEIDMGHRPDKKVLLSVLEVYFKKKGA